eukprot:TRINITY_DN290_c0_g1_i1.p1 TRINITY_DN290_c0_g1~~TRINITY_DN290_c0_g1_i1.p1  ORF type:complete len:1371 (-),score=418.39 TRINITY_DN290_c0_g1_i1:1882-5994(-)
MRAENMAPLQRSTSDKKSATNKPSGGEPLVTMQQRNGISTPRSQTSEADDFDRDFENSVSMRQSGDDTTSVGDRASDGEEQTSLPCPGDLRTLLGGSLAALPLLERYQVVLFLRAANQQQQQGSNGRRSFFGGKKPPATTSPTQPARKIAIEDMLAFQKDPIPTSLLRMNNDLMLKAVKIFQEVLSFMGLQAEPGPATLAEEILVVQKLLKHTLKRAELRDELFAQLAKQTRNNPDRESCLKAWDLFHYCASAMAPSKDLAGPLSEYIHEVAKDEVGGDADIRQRALVTWQAMKRTVKAGPRKSIPTTEEFDALKKGKKLGTIAFFLDDTFEEVPYDVTTTVGDAIQGLAAQIQLQNYQTFGLFDCRRTIPNPKQPTEAVPDEHLSLDDNRYLGDVMAEFKANNRERGGKGDVVQSRLLFKKKMYRETDEAITEPVFIQLAYCQAQHDYIAGMYPVNRDDAAQLAALQIIVDFGAMANPEAFIDWPKEVAKSIPKQMLATQAKRDWDADVLSRFKNMLHLVKDDARQQLLRILRALPYGSSTFFTVRRIEDPIGLLPGRITMGINKRGVHFFRPVPKEYLHSAELRDIMQFGSSSSAVFFKMRVAGALHIFQFDTKQGEDICMALQTHINDVMLRRYARKSGLPPGTPVSRQVVPMNGTGEMVVAWPDAPKAGDGSEGATTNGEVKAGADAVAAYKRAVRDMAMRLEQSTQRIEELTALVGEKDGREKRLKEEVEDLQDRVRHAEESARTSGGAADKEPEGLSPQTSLDPPEVSPPHESANGLLPPGGSPNGGEAAATAKRSLFSSLSSKRGSGTASPGLGGIDPGMAAAALAAGFDVKEVQQRLRMLEAQLKEAKKDASAKGEVARKADEEAKKASKEKQLVEQKLIRFTNAKGGEMKALEAKLASDREEMSGRLSRAEATVAEQTKQIGELEATVQEKTHQMAHLEDYFKELEELRDYKEEMERKTAVAAEVIRKQGDQIAELEKLYNEEQVLRKRYFNMMEDMKGKIRVYARSRPLSSKEAGEQQQPVVVCKDEFTLEHPWKDGEKPKQHQFDHVFAADASQEEVFEDTKYLIQSAIDGYNVCIFAYGQTGSGKTYTIYGAPGLPGLTPRAMQELFRCLDRDSGKVSFALKVYMLELYQDNLQDLLAPKGAPKKKLDIKKDVKGMVVVENATIVEVDKLEELQAIVAKGMERRVTAGTNMNAESSRSHLILSIIIEATNFQTQNLLKGKLSFVDLAGSERIKKSGSSGEQLKEAQSINKSLSALGDVISALAQDEPHIPYRNHKLTMLMSDSLGGNAKTLMFVNISPADTNLDETHNSLSYATRVRSIVNDASRNVQTRETQKLRKQISYWKEQAGRKGEEEDLEEI